MMIRAGFPKMVGRKKTARKAKRDAVAVLSKGYKKLTGEWPKFFDMEHKR